MNRLAIIGRGRTGGELLKLLPETRVLGPFHSGHPPKAAELRGAEAAVVFVPGDALEPMLPELLEARLPAVIGTTGFAWPDDLHGRLLARGLPWIVGANFSPGMNFVFLAAKILGANAEALGHPTLRITELHHAGKKDSPSGSALSLRQALGRDAPIESQREGDHRGRHELLAANSEEQILLRHEALDRLAFARGALFAADELLPNLAPGLHHFEKLMQKKLLESLC